MSTRRILFFIANIILFNYSAIILPSIKIVNYEEEDANTRTPTNSAGIPSLVNLSSLTVATTPTTSSLPSVSQGPDAVQSSLAPTITTSNTPALTRPKTAPDVFIPVSNTNGAFRHFETANNEYLKKIIYQEALLRILDKGDLFEKVNKQEQILTERMSKIPHLRKLLESNKLNYNELLFYTCQTGDKSFLLDLPPHRFSTPSPIKPLESDGKVIDEVNPLQMAIAFGQTDIVKLLIASKADTNERSKNNITALEFAINYGKKDIEDLLRQEIALNSTPRTSVTHTTPPSRPLENGTSIPVHASNNNPAGPTPIQATPSAPIMYSTAPTAPMRPVSYQPQAQTSGPRYTYNPIPLSGHSIAPTPPPPPPTPPMSSLMPTATLPRYATSQAPHQMHQAPRPPAKMLPQPSTHLPRLSAPLLPPAPTTAPTATYVTLSQVTPPVTAHRYPTYPNSVGPTSVRYTTTLQGSPAGQPAITPPTHYYDPPSGTSYILPSSYTISSPGMTTLTRTSPSTGALPTSSQLTQYSTSVQTPSSSFVPSTPITTPTPTGIAQSYQPYTVHGSSIPALTSVNSGQKRTSQDAQLYERLREESLKARSESNDDSDDDDDKSTDRSSSINNEPINAFNNRLYNEALMQLYNLKPKGTGPTQELVDQTINSIKKSWYENIKWLGLTPRHNNSFLGRIIDYNPEIFDCEKALIYACLLGDLSFLPNTTIHTSYEGLYLPYTNGIRSKILESERNKLLNPLQLAVIEGHEKVVSLLIKSKFDPKVKTESGLTLLHLAYCHLDKPGLIKLLIDSGVDPNERCISGNTVLHYIEYLNAESTHPKITQECLDILLLAGLDINAKNLKEQHPILKAFCCSHWHSNYQTNIQILLENGADVKGLPEPGHPNSNTQFSSNLQLLLHGYKFISPSPITVNSLTPGRDRAIKRFMEYALRGDLDNIKSLIDSKQISKNTACEIAHEGYSALHFAAARNHHALLDYLLNLKNINLNRQIYNPNRLNKEGETALHSAAKSNAVDAIKVLLTSKNIIDTEILNHKGENALDIAYRLNCQEAVNELIKPIQRPREILLSEYISAVEVVKLISSYVYALNTKSARR